MKIHCHGNRDWTHTLFYVENSVQGEKMKRKFFCFFFWIFTYVGHNVFVFFIPFRLLPTMWQIPKCRQQCRNVDRSSVVMKHVIQNVCKLQQAFVRTSYLLVTLWHFQPTQEACHLDSFFWVCVCVGGGGIASSIPWEGTNGKPSSALIHLLANYLQELPKRMVSERKWQVEESSK